MKLYLFVERSGNHELHEVEVEQANLPPEFVAKQTELTNAGYNLSDSSAYTAQLLNGAKAGMVEQSELDAANAKIAELEGKSGAEKAAE